MADETLEELAEFFDELGDSGLCPEDYDCTLAVRELAINCNGHYMYVQHNDRVIINYMHFHLQSGVLNVKLGSESPVHVPNVQYVQCLSVVQFTEFP